MRRELLIASRLLLGGLVVTALAATPILAAASKKPEDALRGRIILSETPFPASFRSDADFIARMKRADTKGFKYGAREKIPVEFMAFFAEPINVTQLNGTVYDMTEGLRMKETFPIYPGGKGLRVLASFFEMRKDTFEPERRYKLVVTNGYRGVVLAEADFAIKDG